MTSSPPAPIAAPTRRPLSMEALFRPQSIAIVGASDDPARIGGRPVSHMLNQKFEGAVYPVNPKRETIQGIPAYPSLSEIPGDVDFVLVAVPAPLVPGVVREAAAKNARTALIFSSGFSEVGGAGETMQAELVDIAHASGMRIIGPNCLGAFCSGSRFYPTFTSTIDRATPTPGGVAIASQSGAYGSHIYLVSHLRGLGISYWLTTGNEADLHVAEAIQLLAEQDDVHTICAYAEGVKDGAALVEALETARAARKPVIFMKVGRSEVGAAAASSHTASLAGEDRVYDAVLRAHGAHRARSTEEMLDIAYAAKPRIYPAGKRLGLVTISGGAGVLMADAAAEMGLDAPAMPVDAQAEIKEILPFAAARNPVDVTAQFFNDLSLAPRFIKAMLERGGYDGLIGFWTSVAGSPVLGEPLLKHLTETMAEYPEKLFIQSVVAPSEMMAKYAAAGFPAFEDPTRAVAAMAALMGFGEAFEQARPETPALTAPAEIPEGPIGEQEAKRILAAAGLPTVPDALATDAEGAAAAQAAFGRPAAMKIASPDILHKSDIGGVALGVEGPEAARAAFERLVANARSAAPEARIDGVLVSPMAPAGVECILGAKLDPVFGAIVLFGLGGIHAEVMKDVSCRRAPISVETAREMIDEIQGAALLKGARGSATSDLDALAGALSKLSVFAASNAERVVSVEMNPVRAMPEGCLALDALIETR